MVLPAATLLPPARQGDVFRAVRTHDPARIVLIDGAFLDVPAVWHREILWALDRGVVVVGAGSMGALRAAELHGFGMHGFGQVFAAYRDGVLPGWEPPFDDDDEVAIIHAPRELGFAPLSDAMVDLRASLARAEAAGVVGRAARDRLAEAMKVLHFPQRTLAGLIQAARDAGEAELATWLPAHHRSLKADDARVALAAGKLPPAPPFDRERALVWERFVEAQPVDGGESVLERLRQDAKAWRAVFLQAAGRLALRADAAPADATALGRFRTVHGLWTRAALDDWMRDHCTNAAGLARLIAEEAAIDAAVARPSLAIRNAMLDVLRLSGDTGAIDRGGTPREQRDQIPPLSAME